MYDMQQQRRREVRALAAGGSTERAGLRGDGPKRGAARYAETPAAPRIAILARRTSTTRSNAQLTLQEKNKRRCRCVLCRGRVDEHSVNRDQSLVGMACIVRKLEAAESFVGPPEI